MWPPLLPLSFRKQRFLFEFQHQEWAKRRTASSGSLQRNIKYENWSFLLFVRVAFEFFFFSCTVFISFFCFFLMLPTQKTPSLPPFFSLFSSPLPAGFLLQLLVLPHFLCVFVLQDTHRNIRVISIHEYISINEGGETLAEQLIRM